ncbi:MAG: T9SS type A sorting domain-containing protein [Bacteroidota bacterium]
MANASQASSNTANNEIKLWGSNQFNSQGGRIVLAGGLDDGSNGGTASDGFPDGFAYRGADNSGDYTGVGLGNWYSNAANVSLLSGNGDVVVRGESGGNCGQPGIAMQPNLVINSGTGTIRILGKGNSGHGIETGFATAALGNTAITSASTTTPAISIEGICGGSNFGVLLEWENVGQNLIQSTATTGGGIQITGTGAAASASSGIRANAAALYILSTVGDIVITGNAGTDASNDLQLNSNTIIGGFTGSATVNGIPVSTATSTADISLLTHGGFEPLGAITITTGSATVPGGNVLVATNVDNADGGHIYTRGTFTVNSNGGDITLGGGDINGSGFALGSQQNRSLGFRSDNNVTLNSAGGNIVMRCKGAARNDVPNGWDACGISTSGGLFSLNSGTGTINLQGISQQTNTGTSEAIGIIFRGAGARITSANTTSNAITIVGDASAAKSSYAEGVLFASSGTFEATATASGGGITITSLSGANDPEVTYSADPVYILAVDGDISFTASGAGATGFYAAPGSPFVLGSTAATNTTNDITSSTSDIVFNVGNKGVGWSLGTGNEPEINTTGSFTLLSTAYGMYRNWFTFGSTLSSLVFGNPAGNTGGMFIDEALTVGGPIEVNGGAISITGALTATNNDISLNATGAVTQTAAITANKLALNGTGTFTLNNTGNNIATIAGGTSGTRLGSLSFTDASGGLTIGTVGSNNGVFASGTVLVETLVGNLTLSQSISTTNTTSTAVTLNAEKNAAIGISTGGNIIVSGSPTITTGSSGIVRLFSGFEAYSPGLTALAGGQANVRNNADETTTTYSPALAGNNTYAIYRAGAGTGDLTIVASGGDAINTTWGYNNGVVFTITTPSRINASEVVGYLATASLTIQARTVTFEASVTTPTASDFVLKTQNWINLKAGRTVQTNGGDVIFWVDTDNSQATSPSTQDDITMEAGSTINTQGGRIVLAGGLDDGAYGGTASDGIPDNYAYRGADQGGVNLGPATGTGTVVSLLSAGGDIIIKGRTAGASSAKAGIVSQGNVLINSGAGRIDIEGVSSIVHGIEFTWGAVPNIAITSDYAGVGPAIRIAGGTTGNSGMSGILMMNANGGNVLIQSTSNTGGGVLIEGSQTNAAHPAISTAPDNCTTNVQILAGNGNIVLTTAPVGPATAGLGVLYSRGAMRYGSRLNATAVQGIVPAVASTSVNIVMRFNDLAFNASTNNMATTGTVTLAPRLADAGFSSGVVVENMNLSTTSALTVGKSGNSGDITVSSALSVAGPISIYGGTIAVNANLTSSATGDILLKSISNANSCITNNATITKSAGTGTLTMQGHARVSNFGTINTSGSGVLNLVMWSDFDNSNNDGGVSQSGTVSTNGGHVWLGGSNSAGGSYTWNGLTVGDGPSIGSAGYNGYALDLFGPVTTSGGDILVWAGNSSVGASGIVTNGSSTVNVGTGDITLITPYVLGVNNFMFFKQSGGTFTLVPNGGSFPGTFNWDGQLSVIGGIGTGRDFSGNFDYLWLEDPSTLKSLTIGRYDGMLSNGTPVVMTNSSGVTFANTTATSINGPISVYGGDILVQQNLTSSAAGADVLFEANSRIELSANRTVQTNGGDITLRSNASGTAVVTPNSTTGAITLNNTSSLLSNGGNITLGGNYAGTQGAGLYAASNFSGGAPGILISNATINAAGGDIKVYGRCVSSYDDGIRLQANMSTTGSGTIGLFGDAHGGFNASSVYFGGITFATAASAIETVAGDITIEGILTNTQSNSTYAVNFYRSSYTSGSQTNHIQLLSRSGNIQITGDRGTTSASGMGQSSWGNVYVGSPSSGSWTATGDVKFTYSSFAGANQTGIRVKTTGDVTYEPVATSFSAAQILPLNANYILAESASSLTIGKSGNTAGITMNSAQTVAGPITIYGGTITLNAGLTSTNNGDISFYSDNAIAGLSSQRNISAAGFFNYIPQSSSFSAAVTYPVTNLNVNSTGLLIGKTTNTANVTFGNAATINGPVTVYGGNIGINAALTATASNINLHATGAVTQTAALTASGLGLHGTGTFTLTNASNNITTLAGGDATNRLGSLSFVDASGGLTIGSVNPDGITATGDILIETLAGDIQLTEPVTTSSSTNTAAGYAGAIVLNAGKSSSAGTPTGGNIIVSGNGDVDAPNGIVKLYSGFPAGSTGLTTLAGGITNERYTVDENTVSFSPVLTAGGTFGLYRAETLCFAGAASSSPTACVNTAMTNITHTTAGATGIGTATGLPAGVTANWASNVITISGTPTQTGTFNYSIPFMGSCSSVEATGTITVTAVNTAGAASSSPTLCVNTALTNITHATTGATGIGTATGLPAGVTANWASNVITISGTPSTSGTFNYTIPLTGGCGSVNATGTISVTPANTAGVASSSPTLCANAVLTNITHTTTGATGIGTATGLPPGVTANWASNVITISGTPTQSGTFTYSIPLTGGCGSANATGTITVSADNTAGAASSVPTVCINAAMTNITHTTTGATGIGTATGLPPGVTANWASNVITISGTPSTSGTFSYTIPLTGGCGSASATGTITVNSRPTAAISVEETSGLTNNDGTICSGSSVVLTASGGSTYSWGSGTNAIREVSPVSTTSYTVTVTASSGCSATASTTVTVNAAPAPSLSTVNPNCPSSVTGSASSSTGSGWTFLWSTGATTSSITSLVQGQYTLTVTNALGCQGTAIATLTDQTVPVSITVASKTDVRCFGGSSGAATLSVSGGSSPYSYSWSSGQTTASVSSLAAGIYQVTVAEGGIHQCQSVQSVTIQEPDFGVQVSINRSESSGLAADDGVICQNDAAVLTTNSVPSSGATISGYLWSNTPAGITSSISVSSAGTYTVTVTDSYGCTASATSTVTVTPTNTAGAASSSPTPCVNTAMTNITHATTGATGIGTATGLPPGVTAGWAANVITISGTPSSTGTFNYSIPLTGGCGSVNATGTITVRSSNTAGAASSSPTLCVNTALTNITHATTGATGIGAATGLPPGITANWAANMITISGTPTTGGTFSYSIPLTGGCGSVNATGTINVTPANTAGAASAASTQCVNTVMTNITHSTTGATGIGAATGLPPGVTANWASNVITISGTPSTTGTFNYSIPLTGGCGSVSATGTIIVTVASIAPVQVSETSGTGNNDGTICEGAGATLTATGGTSYIWNTSPSSSTAAVNVSPSSTTTYTVTVTDATGCTGTSSYTIMVNTPSTPLVTVSESHGVTDDDGTTCRGDQVTLSTSGGTSYSWNTMPAQTSATVTVSPNSTATYTVIVTDVNLCSATASTTITVNALPTPTISATESFGTTSNDGVICAGNSVTLGTTGGTYVWSGSQTTASITVSPSSTTTYTVTVTDSNNCSATATRSVTVSVPSAPVISATESFGTTVNDGIICAGNSVTLGITGGTYVWSGSQTASSITVSPASTTTYTVTVTDANICTASATRDVTVNALPTPAVSATENSGLTANDGTICFGASAILTASGGTQYIWNTTHTNAAIIVNPVNNATYSVTVTDANMCSSATTRSITVGSPVTVAISLQESSGIASNDGSICAGSNATVSLTGASSYLWPDGSTLASRVLTPACTKSYNVTVTNASLCTTTASVTVQVNAQPEITQITPSSGTAGTTVVHVYGQNLNNTTGVKFNGQSGTSLTIISDTHITAVLPVSGAVTQLEVISACGNATILAVNPVVTSISPASGSAGTIVTVSGLNLDQINSAAIGSTTAVILSKSSTTARLMVMPGTSGGTVTVSTPTSTASSVSSFTVSSTPHPYIQQGAKFTNSSTSSQQGQSVAVSADGNTAIIGGPGDNSNTGAAWIYVRSGTAWSQQAKLVGSGAVGAARQGISVALSADGNTAVVGGSSDNSSNGAVWVFTRTGTDWAQQGNKLVGAGGTSTAQQGTAVAISSDGNKIASGAIADNLFVGAVWVFERNGNTWTQSGEKLTPSDGIEKPRLGVSVSLSADGSRLLAGGYLDNVRQGAAWIFDDTGCGMTQSGQKLVGTGGNINAWQGYSVALSADGNTAMIGGCNDNNLAGSAWIFTNNGSSWTQQVRLIGGGATGSARQGSAVALSADGNTAISAGFTDDSGKGAFWVYKKAVGGTWVQQDAKVRGSNATGASRQGTSVAVSANGHTALVGGPVDATNTGAFWVFIPGTLLQSGDSGDRQAAGESTEAGEFSMAQNIPNPTTGSTVVPFNLPAACLAEWEITDVSGRIVQFFRREYPAGANVESFDMSNYSGMYYYRLKTPFGCLSKSMLIVR